MNYHNNILKNFYNNGFTSYKINKNQIAFIKNLKNEINKKFKNFFAQDKFENFHKYNSFESINNTRMRMINYINTRKKLKIDIYLALKPFLDSMIGPDVVVQKNINLSIQMPFDDERPLLHKDTPLSSMHELVIWIPLVNCKDNMCMSMIPKNKHDMIESLFKENDEVLFEKYAKKYGVRKNIKVGDVLIFNANNFHYIPLNTTKLTRWSLNIRFKNLFTPYGQRNLLDYYEIINTSPLTKMNSY
jgi:sporadic carbohydrate cluster 2OG-Fe(II) oxygenase